MIKDTYDNKITARVKAQNIIMHALANAQGYWSEDDYATEGMTKKEIQAVCEQLKKECDRIAKKFGFRESWSN